MKLLIAVDMEGISGVTCWDHVDPSKGDYERFRRVMTADVNAAVQGAFDGGVEQVIVCDGHNLGANILIEELDERALLNCGLRPDHSMVDGVESGVDAAMLVGYHARAGTPQAVLCHTFTLGISNLVLNDRPIGEIGMAAVMCGHYNVPVIMISSDQAGCNEACQWIPTIETVATKKGSGRYAADCIPPLTSQAAIREKSKLAVQKYLQGNAPAPLKAAKPLTLRVVFENPARADGASLLPGFNRIDGTTFEFQADDAPAAFRCLAAAMMLGH
jgi:D-amino peptidase